MPILQKNMTPSLITDNKVISYSIDDFGKKTASIRSRYDLIHLDTTKVCFYYADSGNVKFNGKNISNKFLFPPFTEEIEIVFESIIRYNYYHHIPQITIGNLNYLKTVKIINKTQSNYYILIKESCINIGERIIQDKKNMIISSQPTLDVILG